MKAAGAGVLRLALRLVVAVESIAESHKRMADLSVFLPNVAIYGPRRDALREAIQDHETRRGAGSAVQLREELTALDRNSAYLASLYAQSAPYRDPNPLPPLVSTASSITPWRSPPPDGPRGYR